MMFETVGGFRGPATRLVSRLVFPLAALVAIACGSASGSGGDDDSANDPANDSKNPLGGGNGTAANDGATGATSPKTGVCSGDLHSLLDSNGGVVETCAADQGCAGGSCAPACDAAAASHGSVGCDFVVATPSFATQTAAPCFAVFVANNWGTSVHLGVAVGTQSLDVTAFGRIPTQGTDVTAWPTVSGDGLAAGQVAVLFLSSDPNAVNTTPISCPVPDAINAGTAVPGTGRGQAFHISASAPITAYDMLPFGGALSYLPSAELVLPTSAWGTNYVAVVPQLGEPPVVGDGDPDDSDDDPDGPLVGPQWGQVVAASDNTTVTISSPVALPAGAGVDGAAANQPAQYKLNAGEFIQWQGTGSTPFDISGAVLSSDKPVSFTGGNGYLCLHSQTSPGGGGCDSGHQIVPPVSALGNEYAVAPFATRRADLQEESVPYRFVGAVAGTTLTYDPPQPAAPATIGVGQVVDFEATAAFVVKSQDNGHPFYVGMHMPGCSVIGGSRPGVGTAMNDVAFGNCLGDEEWVGVFPPAQFLSSYVFFTDPTYATTNLVLTRAKSGGAFHDVSVDCLGVVGGWQPLGTSGQYQTTNVDLMRGAIANGTCANGPQHAKSDGPMGIVVWGLDNFSSYAYPAGGNVASINTVVVQPSTLK